MNCGTTLLSTRLAAKPIRGEEIVRLIKGERFSAYYAAQMCGLLYTTTPFGIRTRFERT